MNYNNLYLEFKEVIPESVAFCKKTEEENLVDDSVGSHVQFGMVVVPYIIFSVNNEEKGVIGKCFSFLEQMALSDDIKIQEVLDFTVLEQLADEGFEIFNKCKNYMGMNTLQHCEKVEQYFL